MKPSQEEVLELVARGELSAEQADKLLASIPARRSRLRILVHPLDSITTEQALLACAVAAAAAFLLGAFGVRFDGALDLHVGAQVALGARALDLAVAVALPALVFWAWARIASGQVRFVDFIAAVGLARVPYVLGAPLLLGLGHPTRIDDALRWTHEHPFQVALTALVSLALLGWLVTLLYTGVKTASGLGGKKLTVAFVVLLIAAEIGSKLVLFAVR
jgi:Yip1-like protein